MKPWTDACSSRAMPSATRRSAASSAVGSSTTTWSSRLGRERAGRAGAGGALGGGEHAGAPVVVGGREVVRADDDDRAALGEVGAELGGAGEDVAAVGDLALQQRGEERGLRGLRRAVGRAQALDLRRDHRRRDPQHRGGRPAAARAHAQAADHRVTHAQLVRLDAVGVAHELALVRRRARGDREHGARAVDQDERRVEGAGGGTDDLREDRGPTRPRRTSPRVHRGREAPPPCGRARTRPQA